MKQFGIDKKKISKTLRCALAIALTASVLTSACACDKSATESSMEASVPDSTTIETTAETTRVTNPTNETQETIVYIYGGRYYMAGDPQIEGKSGLTSMTLSDARDAGFNAGSAMTQDEKTAYDYNLAWNMVAEGKSDEEIIDALINTGYSNEYSAQFMVNWVREDWDMGIRAYEEPQNTPTVPSSNGGNSGSGNSGSGSSTEPTGSTYVPSDVTPIPTQSTQPTTAPTSAPTETTQPTSAPTQPTSAPTEPTSAPTEPTSAPTETTPAPTEAKYITHYEFNGIAYDDADNSYSFSCTGSSYQNCLDQFETYCNNHGYYPSNYNCAAVWSDGSMTYA
ncbi:hypothetical protein [Pseudobutyrivibrio sp.]|jgi:hypothetical protein|uniref:hypothetical protein n=1 Tax=Pseudobutyrivibrio sp. TaxID=2014367 RepID=UPI0025FE115A|nr:hypothetical protein [Pseudobutyrivibrio sp.]